MPDLTTKPRQSTGGAYPSRGKWYARVTVAPRTRESVLLPWARPEDEAPAHDRARALQGHGLSPARGGRRVVDSKGARARRPGRRGEARRARSRRRGHRRRQDCQEVGRQGDDVRRLRHAMGPRRSSLPCTPTTSRASARRTRIPATCSATFSRSSAPSRLPMSSSKTTSASWPRFPSVVFARSAVALARVGRTKRSAPVIPANASPSPPRGGTSRSACAA